MSSFVEHCLDSYDNMEKKTASSIAGMKGLSSYMKHMADVFKKCSGDAQSVCSKYKGKEIKVLEGTVNAAVIAVVSDIESTVVAPFSTLYSEFERTSKEIDAWVKEHEQSRKKLVSEANRMQKDWDATMAQLKKAKESYFKLAKDAATAQANSEKAQEKNAAAAKQKADAAADKAQVADDAYSNTLVHTNDAQYTYYTETQPNMLKQFQQWESERVEFVKNQISVLAEHILALELPNKWEGLTSSFKGVSDNIDVDADIESYARSVGTDVPVPEDMPYEAAPVGPSFGGPDSLSTHPGGSKNAGKPSRPKTEASAPAPAAAAPAPAPAPASDPAPSGGDNVEGKESSGEGERFKSLFDYDPQNDGELAIKEGEILTITEKDESGWWYAITADGKEGFVPASYVEPA